MLPPDSVLLDRRRPGLADEAGALLFSRPRTALTARAYGDVLPLLEEVQRQSAAGRYCVGFIAYEAAYAIHPQLLAAAPAPAGLLAWFGVYEQHDRLESERLAQMLGGAAGAEVFDVRFAVDRAAYRRQVARIKQHIRDGDVYQVNLTAPLRFRCRGSPLALYRELRQKQRVGFGGVLRMGDDWLVSLSPELFVRRDGDRLIVRPMKGTAPRGVHSREDRARAAWLRASEKNRAENLMIVDLLRNDLSVVARPGSVRVTSLFDVERYETLWQMTSTIEAEARPGVGVAEVLRALLPSGSVTGAPKLRALEIIRDIEAEPRGAYCGAIGMVRPGGDFVFNVPIRTIEIRDGRGRMGVGSGIVWDSDPEAEYDECLLKGRFLTAPPAPAFELLETMRAEDGSVALLDRHLERLREAADYFEFPFEADRIRQRLSDLGQGSLRVRLLLSREGHLTLEAEPLDASAAPQTAIIYPEHLPEADAFLAHKTTHRPFHDRALAWARAQGADEAILLNTRGEVVEGTFTNVWVRQGGRLLTPRLASIGLPGVYRAHLLATRSDAAEALLSAEDLMRAEAVLLSNAVRGLVPVSLIRAEIAVG